MLAANIPARLLAAAQRPSIQAHANNSTGKAVAAAGIAMFTAWGHLQDLDTKARLWAQANPEMTDHLLQQMLQYGLEELQELERLQQAQQRKKRLGQQEQHLLEEADYVVTLVAKVLLQLVNQGSGLLQLARCGAHVAAFAAHVLAARHVEREVASLVLYMLGIVIGNVPLRECAALVTSELVDAVLEQVTARLEPSVAGEAVTAFGPSPSRDVLGKGVGVLYVMSRLPVVRQAVAKGQRATAIVKLLEAAKEPALQLSLLQLLLPREHAPGPAGSGATGAPALLPAVQQQLQSYKGTLPLLLRLAGRSGGGRSPGPTYILRITAVHLLALALAKQLLAQPRAVLQLVRGVQVQAGQEPEVELVEATMR